MDTTASSIAYEWLHDLLAKEIEVERSAVLNEHNWAIGCPDPESADIHAINAKAHEFYVQLLKDIYRKNVGHEYVADEKKR